MPGTTTEILPCPNPWCGGECCIEPGEYDDDPFRAVCDGKPGDVYHCGYRGPYGEDESSAIAAHNAIASAVADRDRLAAENERLKALLEGAVVAMDAWGADEDGIPMGAWDVYEASRDALGVPVVMMGTQEDVDNGEARYLLYRKAKADLAATAPTQGVA